MTDFTEVAPRVWVARQDWMHLNITLIGGERGLVMVDSHGSEVAARAVVDDIRRLGAGDVVALVNTHEHWDHTFGNAVVRDEFGAVPIHATDWAAEHTIEAGERVQRRFADDPEDPRSAEVLASRILPADHTFSSALALDLGDRFIELVHPGRGHTAGDLVLRVPDANVLVAGDLVEETDPPVYGGDSYPFDWPASLDLVLGLIDDETVVVPGHGAVVDREFVHDQRSEIGVVAETIRDLASRGVPASEALAQGEWPWSPDLLAEAVRRGYDQLPRGARQLPLI